LKENGIETMQIVDLVVAYTGTVRFLLTSLFENSDPVQITVMTDEHIFCRLE
jgi:hypothetical protein